MGKNYNIIFEKIARTILSKLKLEKCYVSSKWIGSDFTLSEGEPFFTPGDASKGLVNAKVCCFSNADAETTRQIIHDGNYKAREGHGLPCVAAVALAGVLPFRRFIYVFLEDRQETIIFDTLRGRADVSSSPLFEGTEFENGIPSTKDGVTVAQAIAIRRIGLALLEDRQKLNAYVKENNLNRSQVLAVINAKDADQMLIALTMDAQEDT